MTREELNVLPVEHRVEILLDVLISTIARVNKLEAQLAGIPPMKDWQTKAVALKHQGMNNATIANEVGKSRQTVSLFLNKPEIKALLVTEQQENK